LGFCESNETSIFMSKFSMEAFLKINYELVFQRKGGAQPPKRCANIIADFETFKRYGDFDT
jgi:hypothetical protein